MKPVCSIESCVGLAELSKASGYAGNHSLGRTLYGVACGHLFKHPGNILEVGTFNGYSALWLAAAQLDSHKPGKVLSLDIRRHSRAKYMDAQPVEFWRTLGFEVIKDRDAGFDVAKRLAKYTIMFVDGEHTREAVCSDLEAYSPLLEPTALVLLHDAYDPGVRDGALTWAKGLQPKWEFFHLHAWGALAAARRQPWTEGY